MNSNALCATPRQPHRSRRTADPARRTCLRVAAAALAGFAAARFAHAVDAGQRPPVLVLPTADGTTASLEALRGKVVLLDFWASWCGPCKLSFPWLGQMQARHGARGLQVLAVNVDRDRRAADGFLREVAPQMAAPLRVAFDPAGETPRNFKVTAMPSSVLIGADGLVVLQHAGFRDDDRAPLEAAIVAALQRGGR